MRRRRDRTPRNWPLVAAAVVAVLLAALAFGHGRAYRVPGLDGLEQRSIDWRFRARGPRPFRDARIVVVGLDDETRRAAPEVFQTRRGWARLIRALGAAEPDAIALDLFFSSREVILSDALAAEVEAAHTAARAEAAPSPALAQATAALGAIVTELHGDDALAAAIADAKVVVLGALFRLVRTAAERPATAPPEPGGPRRRPARRVGRRRRDRAQRLRRRVHAAGDGGRRDRRRRGQPLPRRRRRRAPHAAGDRVRRPLLPVARPDAGRAGHPAADPVRRRRPPGDARRAHLPTTARLDFLGRPFPRVSAAAILDGRVGAAELEGKILIVGMTYAAYDKVPTPFDPTSDGVELHATLLHNLLYDELLRDAGVAAQALALAVFAALAIALQARRLRRRLWLPLVIAVGAIAGCGGDRPGAVRPRRGDRAGDAGGDVRADDPRRDRGDAGHRGPREGPPARAFAQYVSRSLVERIVANPAAARLGGERREMTVMFSDIRGFSRIAESLPPEQLADFLNEYLTPMTAIVLERDGTLDKYIGDAVMAMWNAPVDVGDHAARACDAALAMQAALGPLNRAWAARGKPTIHIGVGINTGPMSVGNMGSEARFDYTVLGDAVNLAARLEPLTKEYGVDILCGEATAAAARASCSASWAGCGPRARIRRRGSSSCAARPAPRAWSSSSTSTAP
jgi:adenylate cyclase